jgi:hypothetical protein
MLDDPGALLEITAFLTIEIAPALMVIIARVPWGPLKVALSPVDKPNFPNLWKTTCLPRLALTEQLPPMPAASGPGRNGNRSRYSADMRVTMVRVEVSMYEKIDFCAMLAIGAPLCFR